MHITFNTPINGAKLVKEGGVFRLAADSPAIGKAVGNDPYAGEDDRTPACERSLRAAVVDPDG